MPYPYGALISFGIVLFRFFSKKAIKKLSLLTDDEYETCFLSLLTGMLIGGRLLAWLIDSNHSLIDLFSLYGGFSVIGSTLGASLTLYISIRMLKKPFLETAGIFARYAPIVNILGRIGCFYASCCGGFSFLGLPLQLISAFYYTVIFICMPYVPQKKTPFSYITSVLTERMIFGHFRSDITNPDWYMILAQILLISINIAQIFIFHRQKK